MKTNEELRKMAEHDVKAWAKRHGVPHDWTEQDIQYQMDYLRVIYNTEIPNGVNVYEDDKIVFVRKGSEAELRLRAMGLPMEGRFGDVPFVNLTKLPAFAQVQQHKHQPREDWLIVSIILMGTEKRRNITREIILDHLRFGVALSLHEA